MSRKNVLLFIIYYHLSNFLFVVLNFNFFSIYRIWLNIKFYFFGIAKVSKKYLTCSFPQRNSYSNNDTLKNSKAMIRSLGDTDFFYIVSTVLQRDTLAPYMFLLCLDHFLWTLIDKIKEKCFHIKKEKKQMTSYRNWGQRRKYDIEVHAN